MTLLLLLRSHGSEAATYQTPVTAYNPRPERETFPQRRLRETFGGRSVGTTLYRVDGVWHSSQTPNNAVLATADLVLRGGHQYVLDGSTVAEIAAAGFTLLRI